MSLTRTATMGRKAFVSKHRFVAYGIYDLPVGRDRHFGSAMPKWIDAVVGGWQTTFNMFAKSGTGFTPFWFCDNCDPVEPGNVAVGSVDAVGDFGAEPSFRPVVASKNLQPESGDAIWNAACLRSLHRSAPICSVTPQRAEAQHAMGTRFLGPESRGPQILQFRRTRENRTRRRRR